VVNQFQSENSQTQRHEVDVLRVVENSLRPTFQGTAPSGIVTFELYTEYGSIVQFASREWNEGILQPELLVHLSDNSVSSQMHLLGAKIVVLELYYRILIFVCSSNSALGHFNKGAIDLRTKCIASHINTIHRNVTLSVTHHPPPDRSYESNTQCNDI
jgi:hypothetical protein